MKIQAISLPDVLRSKRFVSAVVGMIVAVIIVLIPDLQAQEDALLNMVTTFILFLVGGYSVQDALAAHRTGVTKYDKVPDNG
jgi:hypothetical protein